MSGYDYNPGRDGIARTLMQTNNPQPGFLSPPPLPPTGMPQAPQQPGMSLPGVTPATGAPPTIASPGALPGAAAPGQLPQGNGPAGCARRADAATGYGHGCAAHRCAAAATPAAVLLMSRHDATIAWTVTAIVVVVLLAMVIYFGFMK